MVKLVSVSLKFILQIGWNGENTGLLSFFFFFFPSLQIGTLVSKYRYETVTDPREGLILVELGQYMRGKMVRTPRAPLETNFSHKIILTPPLNEFWIRC